MLFAHWELPRIALSLPQLGEESHFRIEVVAPEFEGLRKCRCTRCGLDLVVTQCDVYKWRINSKRAPDQMETGICPVCRTSCNTLGRKLGSWPIRSFERLSQEAKEEFMLNVANKGGGEMIEQLVSHLTKQRVEYEHSWAQRDWKPLGVCGRQQVMTNEKC